MFSGLCASVPQWLKEFQGPRATLLPKLLSVFAKEHL